MTELLAFSAALRRFINDSLLPSGGSESAFNGLALELFRLQFQHNAAYRRLCEARRIAPGSISSWREIPSVPAAAFKESDLTCLAPADRSFVFQSSGTTARDRSRHFHCDASLAIYHASILPWFEHCFLGDLNDLVDEQLLGPLDKLPMLFLTPDKQAAPNSSLVDMFATIANAFGSRDSLFAGRSAEQGAWTLDLDRALFAIRKSMCANRPLAILGTAFNFVHLLDHFAANNMRYRLARGSRVLETGGYKGQSREVSKKDLHALITKHLGIAPELIVTEYGMCELSSQAYTVPQPSTTCPATAAINPQPPAPLHFPPWARCEVVSPETGREVADGETGLIRIFDLANVFSVMAIQTEDLGIRRGAGCELIGRAPHAVARGCSLLAARP